MFQQHACGLILLTGILFSTSSGVQVDLCLNSSGVIRHMSSDKFVRQWLLVSKNCETPGSVLLLNLTGTNLTCQKGDMSLGISAVENIPNLCSFRKGGCFIVSSSSNSSFGCQREQVIYRDTVLPVTIALSKTASDVERGFEIRYQFLTGKIGSTNAMSQTEAPTTARGDLLPSTIESRVNQSPATPQELSMLYSHASDNAVVYLSLTIAFGVLLLITLIFLTVLLLRSSKSTDKETNGNLSKSR